MAGGRPRHRGGARHPPAGKHNRGFFVLRDPLGFRAPPRPGGSPPPIASPPSCDPCPPRSPVALPSTLSDAPASRQGSRPGAWHTGTGAASRFGQRAAMQRVQAAPIIVLVDFPTSQPLSENLFGRGRR